MEEDIVGYSRGRNLFTALASVCSHFNSAFIVNTAQEKARCVDPLEENDADDEGDIWYNPIPEDEEPEQTHSGRPSIRLHPPRQRARVGADARTPDSAEAPTENPSMAEVAVHSSESVHVHRQILACKNQDDGGPSLSKTTIGPEVPSISIGFSPPSSPNPTKKSSSINWSFPDKIKSPRTVRKISMKMKKLPELSRKLSPPRLSAPGGGQASRNVISRYHLDSSVSTQNSFSKKKSSGTSKSSSKGGVTRTHQLAVKLEPRGLIYVKLSLMEQWQNSLDGPDGSREPVVFGLDAWRVVERENTGLMVPLLISKCINEIEKRGCQVVGLYRLCGSAAVKKELREAFERDSHGVELCENIYPDINVITGVLKDYLRELPFPLINKQLYEAVLESMALRPLRMGASGCENESTDSDHTVALLDILPDVEKVTLHKLLNHLKLVASYQEVNKMTCQNLAVCFGPVLLSQRQEASCHSNRVFIDSEELASALHFKKHIEVLHYLLQLWPVVDPQAQPAQLSADTVIPTSLDLLSAPPIRRRKERPQVLNLSEAEMAGVLRPKPGRLDSPSNRYAGDWSGCGENYFPMEMLPPACREEADYDDVASEDNDGPAEEKREDVSTTGSDQSSECVEQEQAPSVEPEEVEEEEQTQVVAETIKPPPELQQERLCEHILPPRHIQHKEHTYQAYMKIQDISPVLSNRVNLRDLQESIDTLIGNLERELNKNKLNVGY
uniref:Rho-GAP domain-containing protein n=1 Tax=Knipowitschia caucasica TaxID=637954 RepID=A0AAV2KSX2_KNICA